MRNWYLSNLDITQYSSKINTIDVSKSAPKKNTAPTDSTNRAFAASLNFRLACWQPCDELLIFNELDVDAKPSDDQCQLLANILRSVGCLASSLPRADLIDWPVEKDGIQDKSDARKMMSAYIDTRTGKTSVLLMGKIAFELFSSTEKTYADTLGGTMKIKGAVNAFVVKSLQEILKDPSAKLEVWEAIQSLVKTN
jgi:hypothetical protein|tara:strand:+ start:1476 stop:2063 length:588 start_codon:yes stop_codon:yes gene_type:complete